MEDEEKRQAALEPVLARIPAAWGKWVSCGPGWDELILATNEKLARIDSNYEIQQVKEKFGGLRFYASTEVTDPEARLEFDRIISEAELEASRTCEACGSTEPPVTTKAVRYWVQTLCQPCRTSAEEKANG